MRSGSLKGLEGVKLVEENGCVWGRASTNSSAELPCDYEWISADLTPSGIGDVQTLKRVHKVHPGRQGFHVRGAF